MLPTICQVLVAHCKYWQVLPCRSALQVVYLQHYLAGAVSGTWDYRHIVALQLEEVCYSFSNILVAG